MAKIVVNEGLDQKLASAFAILFAGDGYNVGYKRADQPGALNSQSRRGKSGTVFAAAEASVRGAGECECWTDTPNHSARSSRRQVQGKLYVPKSCDIPNGRRECRLLNHGNNRTGNEIPIVVELERDDRFNL